MREGGYVPSFIEHRKRSEQALISVIQEAVVKGVSTRKIEAVLEELGIAGVSAGQVSQLCAALDEKVRKFREGPLGEMIHSCELAGANAFDYLTQLQRHALKSAEEPFEQIGRLFDCPVLLTKTAKQRPQL